MSRLSKLWRVIHPVELFGCSGVALGVYMNDWYLIVGGIVIAIMGSKMWDRKCGQKKVE